MFMRQLMMAALVSAVLASAGCKCCGRRAAYGPPCPCGPAVPAGAAVAVPAAPVPAPVPAAPVPPPAPPPGYVGP